MELALSDRARSHAGPFDAGTAARWWSAASDPGAPAASAFVRRRILSKVAWLRGRGVSLQRIRATLERARATFGGPLDVLSLEYDGPQSLLVRLEGGALVTSGGQVINDFRAPRGARRSLHPAPERLACMRARWHLRLGNPEAAKRELQPHEEDRDCAWVLGNALYALGDYAGALRAYAGLWGAATRSSRLWYDLALCFLAAGDWQKACACSMRSIHAVGESGASRVLLDQALIASEHEHPLAWASLRRGFLERLGPGPEPSALAWADEALTRFWRGRHLEALLATAIAIHEGSQNCMLVGFAIRSLREIPDSRPVVAGLSNLQLSQWMASRD